MEIGWFLPCLHGLTFRSVRFGRYFRCTHESGFSTFSLPLGDHHWPTCSPTFGPGAHSALVFSKPVVMVEGTSVLPCKMLSYVSIETTGIFCCPSNRRLWVPGCESSNLASTPDSCWDCPWFWIRWRFYTFLHTKVSRRKDGTRTRAGWTRNPFYITIWSKWPWEIISCPFHPEIFSRNWDPRPQPANTAIWVTVLTAVATSWSKPSLIKEVMVGGRRLTWGTMPYSQVTRAGLSPVPTKMGPGIGGTLWVLLQVIRTN